MEPNKEAQTAHIGKSTIEEIVQRVGHWLPSQGPIKDFVHHNTLHSFQHLDFPEAIASAARLYGANSYMPKSFYYEAFKSGQITSTALDRALERVVPKLEDRHRVRQELLAGRLQNPIFPGICAAGLRSIRNQQLNGRSLDRLVHPQLFRLIGGYLDQGLSMWRMPSASRLDFFSAVGELSRRSKLPLHPLNSPTARQLFSLSAKQALVKTLARLVGNENYHENYLLESMLSQPGWAGMVAQCEREPQNLLSPRDIHLLDYAAVTMIIELAVLEKHLGENFKPLSEMANLETHVFRPGERVTPSENETLLFVWQKAFEWTYYEQALGSMIAASEVGLSYAQPSSAWAFFCIDDRECSLRRHIEEANGEIETFATAGFFGLDFMYRGAEDHFAAKHCPLPMNPKHLVVEEVDAVNDSPHLPWNEVIHMESTSNTFFRGWLLSYALGLGAAIRLALNVFRPSLAPISVKPLSTVSQQGRLRLMRTVEAAMHDGLWLGYSAEELANRVQSVLQSVGAVEQWPELVVFFGHTSSSVNNPYFAAYNCGACSGQSGAPNARAFAEAANMPDVRKILKERKIEIPSTTWFIGAIHDTCRDEVTYFDRDRLPARLQSKFARFQKSVDSALERNAAERSRRFKTMELGIDPKQALQAVRTRAVSLFEPRPEYNHATNAMCIIGRRKLTENLFLDRRAFLNSYDPTKDADGRILSEILTAAIPVCGGINLEYFFSRVDPAKYGASSKLPQNVTGLLGVCNGIEGDLLTGLPTQMTEIHDPIRLLVVVEQTPELALMAAKRFANIYEWIHNHWVRYACIDPQTMQVWMLEGGQMQKVENLPMPSTCWRDSLEAASQGRGNLAISFVRPRESGPRC